MKQGWLVAGGLLPVAVLAGMSRQVDPQTGLAGWKLREGDFELELVQRLPDQTRAFFLARGFPKAEADRIAVHCVMQTIVRNTGQPGAAPPLRVNLNDWRVHYKGVIRPLRHKEAWLAEWAQTESVPGAAQLAFRWSTLPTEQVYAPRGDYNWGMTLYDLPPGETFDLYVVWHAGERRHAAWLRGVQCAPDRHQ